MIPRECKRLAEVDFPIAEVSRHAVREKSIRHGHPSTLHLWWARRPLASSRAVLMALLLPDPCDAYCSSTFRKEARRVLLGMSGRPSGWTNEIEADEGLRRIILKFIADFANWDLSAKQPWLDTARALVRAAHGDEARKLIDEQSKKFRATFGSAARHGLREGRLAPEEFCTVKGIGAGIVLLGPDAEGEFGSGLLLAEVAVVATVTDIVPGFGGSAWIESLLELGDVEPLHGHSPTPDYVLVPVQRVVGEDRVFCGGYSDPFDPVIGMRVVVIGPWVQGVVPVGAGQGNSTLFATVQKDGESLRWSHGSTGPPNLVDLQARVAEAVSGNLFSLTSHLVRLEEGAEERWRFGREWATRSERGCRLIAVDEDSSEETEICIDPKAPAAAKARFEKASRQQCADGGALPFAEVVSGSERIETDICER